MSAAELNVHQSLSFVHQSLSFVHRLIRYCSENLLFILIFICNFSIIFIDIFIIKKILIVHLSWIYGCLIIILLNIKIKLKLQNVISLIYHYSLWNCSETLAKSSQTKVSNWSEHSISINKLYRQLTNGSATQQQSLKAVQIAVWSNFNGRANLKRFEIIFPGIRPGNLRPCSRNLRGRFFNLIRHSRYTRRR